MKSGKGGQPAAKAAKRSGGGPKMPSKGGLRPNSPPTAKTPKGGPTPKPKQAMRSSRGPKVGSGKLSVPKTSKGPIPTKRTRTRSG